MPYRFFSRNSVIDDPISLFGRQTIEDAVYRQHLVCLFEFGVLNSSHGHNVVRRKELPVIRRHVLVRFGKILIGDIVRQFVPYAHTRIVPARVGKANVRILPDCYDEYADTVLRQIKIFCVQHARVYLISEIAQRIVEFTVCHVMFAVQDGGDVLPHDDFRLRLRNEFDIVPHQACLYYPIPNSQVRRRS